MTLPNWPGAGAVYSKAYRRLEEMAANGHVSRHYRRGWHCSVSQEMADLITALNEGSEESIKAALLFPDYHATTSP